MTGEHDSGEVSRDTAAATEETWLREIDRELQAARARTVRLERENRRLRADNEALRAKLDAVYQGETFRLGQALLRGPRWFKRALDRRRSRPGTPPRDRRPPSVDARWAHQYRLEEDTAQRRIYEAVTARTDFRGSGTRLALAVSTTDLTQGRGDLYTAVGLARALEPLGYDVLLLPPDRWYDPPSGTDVLVALVAEPRLAFEPHRVRSHCRLVAWVRNNTDRWAQQPGLPLFDAVLASSARSAERLQRWFDGPVGVLPVGVDEQLFHPPAGEQERAGVLSTVNQWGADNPRRVHEHLAAIDVDFPLALHGVQRGLAEHLAPFAAGPASFFALPGLYRQAALVLDDVQDVNRRFGNVNSRVYEALACGALPLAGSSRGLEEAGLGEVPTYSSGEELRALVRHYLEAPQERAELVERLRAVVAARHSYAARARDLDAFLQDPGVGSTAGAPSARRPLVVGFMPDYRATNPYQSMLYARLRSPRHAPVPVEDPGSLAATLTGRGAPGILHLNWTATILGPASRSADANARADRYLAELDTLRERGGRVVWTVHNVLPHDCRFPEVEARLRQGIADRADAVHVLCERTADEVRPHYELPADRLHVLGHGSYVDVYPNVVSQKDARGELGVPGGAMTYLFLGQVRPYKGVEDLLDGFDRLAAQDAEVHLLVAGKPVNHPGADELRRRCDAHAHVTGVFRELADEELQVFVNAADVVVLPHRQVLNSGGVMLAYTFGRPVVAPKLGCLEEQVSAETGVLFDPGVDGLTSALQAARELRSDDARRAAYERARAYTYLDMATDFQRLVDEVAAS